MKTKLNLIHSVPLCLTILGGITLTAVHISAQTPPVPPPPPAPALEHQPGPDAAPLPPHHKHPRPHDLAAVVPPPPPDHERGPRRPGPAGERPAPEKVQEDVSGSVAQYLVNLEGEADGLLLADGTRLRFPPHMSADLVRVVKPGARITARGVRESDRSFRAFTITDEASHTTVVESRPSAPPATPPTPEQRQTALKTLQAKGRIKALLTAPRGETDGAVLDNGTLLRFKPEVADRFVKLLATSGVITASGQGTENEIGRVIEVSEIKESDTPPAGAPESAPPPPPAGQPAPPAPSLR